MRAPDTAAPFDALMLVGTISDAHWHDIAAALAERGINLDAARVGERSLRTCCRLGLGFTARSRACGDRQRHASGPTSCKTTWLRMRQRSRGSSAPIMRTAI
jgi:hypothetical protein